MSIVTIYDDILSPEEADFFDKAFNDPYIDWYWLQVGTVAPYYNEVDGDENTIEYPQLTHTIVKDGKSTKSRRYPEFAKLLNAFFDRTRNPYTKIVRARINLQPQFNGSDSYFYNTPHFDGVEQPHMVLLYYPIDSDGDTYIFNRQHGDPKPEKYEILETITPKKGRFALFDGKWFHTGRHPAKSKSRLVLNVNLKLPDIEKEQSFSKFN